MERQGLVTLSGYHVNVIPSARTWSFVRLFVGAIVLHCAAWGSGPAGIWMGETTGRNGEKQDVAFQFKISKGNLAGVMFGEEFDLPLENLKIEGDQISFSVTNINYYNGTRQTTTYTGTLTEKEMRLTRERKGPPVPERQDGKQTIILKRLTS